MGQPLDSTHAPCHPSPHPRELHLAVTDQTVERRTQHLDQCLETAAREADQSAARCCHARLPGQVDQYVR